MIEPEELKGLVTWGVMYPAAGIGIGFLEFTVARVVMRHHPRRDAILTRKMFVLSLLVNAVAWPGVLLWLVLLGGLKLAIHFMARQARRR